MWLQTDELERSSHDIDIRLYNLLTIFLPQRKHHLFEYHAKRYYDDDSPEISDFEYDMLMNELKNLEKEFPDLITEDSMTQKVGGHVKEGFLQVTHEVPLQSLQDVFSIEELEEFDKRVKKQLQDNEKLNYVVETKIDGLSVALEYKNGEFVRGATRGNGLIRRRCN